MSKTSSRPKRKATGGRYIPYRKKKLHEIAREPTLTKLGELKRKILRGKGSNKKLISLSNNIINLYDPKSKKYKKVKIKTIIETPSNRHFVRRNIITKGTIVDTEIGKAKITNRPGQEGTLNGVLI